MVVRGAVVGIVFMLGLAPGVWAQQGDRTVQPDQAQARYKIFVMEGVLEKAVQNGAAIVSRQVRAVILLPMRCSSPGVAQVRGFRLDGLGVLRCRGARAATFVRLGRCERCSATTATRWRSSRPLSKR